MRTDVRQPAAANQMIIDIFDKIIRTTNIVDLISNLLFKNKAYSRFKPSTRPHNKHMCVHRRNHNQRCNQVEKLGATDCRIDGCKLIIIRSHKLYAWKTAGSGSWGYKSDLLYWVSTTFCVHRWTHTAPAGRNPERRNRQSLYITMAYKPDFHIFSFTI